MNWQRCAVVARCNRLPMQWAVATSCGLCVVGGNLLVVMATRGVGAFSHVQSGRKCSDYVRMINSSDYDVLFANETWEDLRRIR